MKVTILYFIAAAITATSISANNGVLVQTSLGSVRGLQLTSRSGREYSAFLGVPYALPPVGPLRFQAPFEALPWDGTLNATTNPPVCLQPDDGWNRLHKDDPVTVGAEDCLYINIFTPKNLSDSTSLPLPVMFYLHGGYESGSQYGADYFMDEDVVLVFVNFRLGVLANLNTNQYNARGNAGMKDQVMALRWVNENIGAFGGNASRITIFGNSGGALSVSGHLLSPMSRGLFQQAIAQSGTLLIHSMTTRNPMLYSRALADKFSCRSDAPAQIPVCLQNIDASRLVLDSQEIGSPFSVETYVDDGARFLPDTPINILQAGGLNPATAMYGVTSAEWLGISLPILAIESELERWNEDFVTNAIGNLFLYSAIDPARIATEAKDFYIGPVNLSRDVRSEFTNFMSDRFFLHPASVFATYQLVANAGGAAGDVFLYHWDYPSDFSHADFAIDMYGRDEGFMGSSHADELQFLFHYARHGFPYIPEGHKDAPFSKMFVKLWASFAKTGRPSGAGTEPWDPISIGQKPYRWFNIGLEPGMVNFVGPRAHFWDRFNETDLYQPSSDFFGASNVQLLPMP